MQHIGKILPVDGYRVQLIDSLPVDYDASLIHLYQPLIGIEPISLYTLLLKEEPLQSDEQIQTHHTLMNYLTMPLDKIYVARRKLEGIGLLKTFETVLENKTVFTYVLQAPFRPAYFFQDMMLSELLYRHIGKIKFETLRKFYATSNQIERGEEVTASFNDVFQTFTPKTPPVSVEEKRDEIPKVPLTEVSFDSIYFMLQRKNISAKEVMTDQHRQIMTQLLHLYDLEMYEMEQAVNWALTEDNKIDIAQLKQACHDLFQAKHNVVQVQLEEKKPSQVKATNNKRASTKLDRLIEWFETASPKDILEDQSMGHNATSQDLKLVSDIMLQQALPIPVMNVLIHYVLLQSNDKLTRNYIESIAAHWSRKKLKTAREAVEFAREQMNQPKKRSVQKNYQRRASGKEEVIPEWFNERHKKEEKEKPAISEADLKEQEALLEALRRHASENN